MEIFGKLKEIKKEKEKLRQTCLDMLGDSNFVDLRNDIKDQFVGSLNSIDNIEQLNQISDSVALLVDNLNMLNGLSDEQDIEKTRKIIQDQLEFIEDMLGIKLIVVNSIFR